VAQDFAGKLTQLSHSVPVRLVATPAESFACALSAWTAPEVLEASHGLGDEFDVLPIRNCPTDPIAAYWQLERDGANCVVAAAHRNIGVADLVDGRAPIPALIRLFVRDHRRFFFVLDEGDVAGLIDWSDLNRPAACTSLFPVVQQVEHAIQTVLASQLNADSWLKYVKPERRRKIEKVAESRRQANIHTDLLSVALFSDLTTICIDCAEIQSMLRRNKDDISAEAELLNRFRERVCHGTESLVDDAFGVDRLNTALAAAKRCVACLTLGITAKNCVPNS